MVNLIFQKMQARVTGTNFVSGYNQSLLKGDLFRLVKIKIENKIFKVRKKWKANVWNLDLSEQMASWFFQKIVFVPLEVTLFLVHPKDAQMRVFSYIDRGQNWKISYCSTKNVEN